MCILYDRYNGNEIRGPPIKYTIVNDLKYSDEDNLDLSLIKYQTEFKELNIHYTFEELFEITEEKKIILSEYYLDNTLTPINIIINLDKISKKSSADNKLNYNEKNYIIPQMYNDDNISSEPSDNEKNIYKKIFFLLIKREEILETILHDNSKTDNIKIIYDYNNIETTTSSESIVKENLYLKHFIYDFENKDLYTFENNTNYIYIINSNKQNTNIKILSKVDTQQENSLINEYLFNVFSNEPTLNKLKYYYKISDIQSIINNSSVKCNLEEEDLIKFYNFEIDSSERNPYISIKNKDQYLDEIQNDVIPTDSIEDIEYSNYEINIKVNDDICKNEKKISEQNSDIIDSNSIIGSVIKQEYIDIQNSLEKMKYYHDQQKQSSNNILQYLDEIKRNKLKINII